MIFSKEKYLLLILFFFLTIFISSLFAQTGNITDSLSLEGLMNTKITTATLTEKSYSKVPSSIQIFTKEDIERSGWEYLNDLLIAIDGVIPGETRLFTCPTVRGIPDNGTGNRFILLIDGIPMNYLLFNGGFFDFPLDIVKQVEVVIGPASPLYGADAFQGVINVITTQTDLYDSKISLSVGNNNTFIGSALYNNSIKDFNFLIHAKGIESDDFDVNDREAYPDSNFQSNESTFRKMRNVYAKFEYKNLSGHFVFYDHFEGYGTYLYTSDKSATRLETYNFALNYKLPFSDVITFNSKIYGTYDKLIPEDTYWDTPALPKLYMSDKNYLLGFEEILQYINPDIVNLTLGFRYEYSKIRDLLRLTTIPDDYAKAHIYKNSAVYFQIEKDFFEKFYLIGGLRYDDSSNFDSVLNPRGGLVYSLDSYTNFKILYGEAFRSPKAYEMYSQQPQSMWSNPNLTSEKLRTIELSANHSFSKYFWTELTLYYNEMWDLISGVIVDAENGINQFQNVNEAESKGANIKFMYNKKPLKLSLSYSYNKSKDLTDNKDVPLPNTNENSLIFNLDYDITDTIIAKVSYYFQGDFDVFETNLYPDQKLDGFHRVDLSFLKKDIIVYDLDLAFRVENLLDADYGYPGVRGGNTVFPSRHLGASRTFSLKFTYHF